MNPTETNGEDAFKKLRKEVSNAPPSGESPEPAGWMKKRASPEPVNVPEPETAGWMKKRVSPPTVPTQDT